MAILKALGIAVLIIAALGVVFLLVMVGVYIRENWNKKDGK